MAGFNQSVLNILFGQDKATIGMIQIDATVQETHVTTAEVTENPVEDGASVVDHVQLRPVEITIEGVISDTPLGLPILQNIVAVGRTVATIFGKQRRSVDAYNALLKLQKERKPFTVTTGLKVYPNMILTELSVPRTSQTSRAIHFTAVMREVVIVKSQEVAATKFSDDVKDRAPATKDRGQKKTDLIPDVRPESGAASSLTKVTKESRGASWLVQIFG